MKQLVIFILLIINTSSYAEGQYKKFGHGKVFFSEQQLTINVEVATTSMQRTIGLMFREGLAENRGMLFDYKEQAVLRVWMRNTLIPLDVVFVSSEGWVVSILKGLQPCIKEPCEIYDSTEKARYMLEINAGTADKNKIAIGEGVLFFM